MKLLVTAALAAALLVAAAPASAATRKCGTVNVQLGSMAEGAAVNIRATNTSCRVARRAARNCVKGREAGWTVRVTSGFRKFVMTKGRARVTYQPAGGGGCGPPVDQ